MPFGNGTGPMGAGPMTGRAAGFCAGYNTPGYANPVGGRGFFGRGRGQGRGRGFGLGLGFGFGRGFGAFNNPYPVATMTAAQQTDDLKQQAQFLQQSLEDINRRIEELEKEKA